MHTPELRQGILALARVEVGDAPDTTFLALSEHWMRVARTTWQESAAFLADVAWQARGDGRSLSEEIPSGTRRAGDEFTVRTRVHLLGLALRYDYRRAALEEMLCAHRGPWDVFSRALYAFALLGQSKPHGLQAMEEVLSDAGDDVKVLHALLHGLWLGESLPRRHQHMLSILSRFPFRGRTDAVALLREAGLLREMRCFGGALSTIDRALEFLPPGDPGVHGDLLRERALIIVARDADAYHLATLRYPGGPVPYLGT
ncbi:hypothetical protein ACFVUW_11240 [Streptomyces xiamenensis]|uniref:hypothetical protein n=1 Tax=Streptomyces xiamenensis TaxID=408015 RepID=UPI0036E350DA